MRLPTVLPYAETYSDKVFVHDRIRYRMLVTNLLRAEFYEEAHAIALLREARRLRSGKRRHRRVKRARDLLRAARKLYARGGMSDV